MTSSVSASRSGKGKSSTLCQSEVKLDLERLDSYLSDSLVAVFNITFIVKRLAKVSTQDTVYSRQIAIYLESYIPIIYLYRYVEIYLSRSSRLNF